MSDLASLLETFFTDRLMRQKEVSEHTIASYRDTFRLLLLFAQERRGKAPSRLQLDDIDAPLIGDFLDHLEGKRGNTARTRNTRLAAIHSFFRFTAFRELDRSAQIQRVLAIPSKRTNRKPVDFLSQDEVAALLAAPDLDTWSGRRDRAMLLVAVQAGLRVSELTGLRCADIHLGQGAHVRCRGKGRKERCTPLRPEAVRILKAWSKERAGGSEDPLFPSERGAALSSDGVSYILAKHLNMAKETCSTLSGKRVTPHVLRHTMAMSLLEAGIDETVIALWLGHERVETTRIYMHASTALKEKAMNRLNPNDAPAGRYKPDDRLLAFLESL
jgi:site-specific recombinase XerD